MLSGIERVCVHAYTSAPCIADKIKNKAGKLLVWGATVGFNSLVLTLLLLLLHLLPPPPNFYH